MPTKISQCFFSSVVDVVYLCQRVVVVVVLGQCSVCVFSCRFFCVCKQAGLK